MRSIYCPLTSTEWQADLNLDTVKISGYLDGVKLIELDLSMSSTSKYHHGDLRAALLHEAALLLRNEGIDGLSLRKLAEKVGVSRMAPYHHFKDKHELLCALAAQGFDHLDQLMSDANLVPSDNLEEQLRSFVRGYLRFATSQPERYDLMFGRPIWKTGTPSDELKQIAYSTFRHYAEKVGGMISNGRLPEGSNPLRLAQASWATLHGLCRLMIDGIYVNAMDMDEVSEESIRVMLAMLSVERTDK